MGGVQFHAGLKGFSTSTMPRVIWRDTGGWPQRHQFGGPTANGLSVVRASNRLLVAEGPRGSVATFPPPHTFFFTREVDVNLGKSSTATTGARQTASASRCPRPSPTPSRNTSRTTRCTTRRRAHGRKCRCSSTPVRRRARRRDRQRWRSRTTTSSRRCRATRRSSTTSISGWSTGCALSGFDTPLQDVLAMKAIGLNVIGLSDFHADSLAAGDYGPSAFPGPEGLRRSVAATLGQGLPGRAVGRAERRLRWPLQRHVAEEFVLVEG